MVCMPVLKEEKKCGVGLAGPGGWGGVDWREDNSKGNCLWDL